MIEKSRPLKQSEGRGSRALMWGLPSSLIRDTWRLVKRQGICLEVEVWIDSRRLAPSGSGFSARGRTWPAVQRLRAAQRPVPAQTFTVLPFSPALHRDPDFPSNGLGELNYILVIRVYFL